MSNENLYEYLTEIGVLLLENIDLFLNIHSIKNEKDFKNEREKLKDSLFQYLKKTSKDDKLLRLISQNLIESYYKSQAVSKYKGLKNLINIYQNKLFLIYNNFFINTSIYIMNKNKATTTEENKDKKKRTISDDNILRKSLDQENKTFKKIPKSAKTKSKPKKKTAKMKEKTDRLEKKALMGEELLRANGGISNNPKLGKQVSDLYIDSIGKKLKMLNQIYENDNEEGN